MKPNKRKMKPIKRTTNYEAIKNMSLEEMAAMFYMFAKPFTELLNMNDDQKAEMRKEIHTFLEAECGAKKQNQT